MVGQDACICVLRVNLVISCSFVLLQAPYKRYTVDELINGVEMEAEVCYIVLLVLHTGIVLLIV